MKTFKVIKTFESITEAEEKTGIFDGSISQVCLGKRNSAGGYYWKHVKKEEED